uniref:DNA methyltransferase n=1 Tax=Flavobacterium sp. TaxID=239 RepID=UPI003750A630
WLDVDMMGGIEYEEFPARIAEVAMWLIDHQMNMQISNEFGQYFARLPLKKSANIVHGDALEVDWETVITKDKLSYILGNPPFIGHQWRNDVQKKGMEIVFGEFKRAGRLDYVAAWYLKAAKFIQGTTIKVAFVSTNSIVQGEQTSILWDKLFTQYNIKIHFAHRTFKWNNEAKGNAGVHVVIIGFASFNTTNKSIFEYEDINGTASEIKAKNINAFLVDAKDIFIVSRGKPIHQFPEMFKGSQPTDGGNLILTKEEKADLILKEPLSEKFIKQFWGADEFLYSKERYCLWLKEIEPNVLKNLHLVQLRILQVKKSRLRSPTPSVQDYANFPTLFTQDRQPKTSYLALPEVSSENRSYIPIGFLSPDIICSNKLQIIPNASLYIFGVLSSKIHNTWVKYVSGRLESRISYSPSVYNNYPFPESPTEMQIATIEEKTQKVLDVRLSFPNSSLADLYGNLTMPPALIKAHNELDKAVDLAYRSVAFTSEANRMVYLFELYEKYTADLFTTQKPKKKKTVINDFLKN